MSGRELSMATKLVGHANDRVNGPDPPSPRDQRRWNDPQQDHHRPNGKYAKEAPGGFGDQAKKSAEKAEARPRKNSLRHAKNSNEVLRQRSIKKGATDGSLDANSGAREGRQFTVANVGNNGKIYLRYVEPNLDDDPSPDEGEEGKR